MNFIILQLSIILYTSRAFKRCKEYSSAPGTYCCGPVLGDASCELSNEPVIIQCNGLCHAANIDEKCDNFACGKCVNPFTLPNSQTITIPYDGTSNDYQLDLANNYFQNVDASSCELTTCHLASTSDCSTPTTITNIALNIGTPITMVIDDDIGIGYTANFCLHCEYNKWDGTQDIIQVIESNPMTIVQSQNQIGCQNYVGPATSVLADQNVAYSSTNLVNQNVGSGFSSFFQISNGQSQCDFQKCEMFNSDCTTAYNQGSKLTIGTASPWQLQGYQHDPVGFQITICYKCTTFHQAYEVTKVWRYTQNQLNCNSVVSVSSFANTQFTFSAGVMQNIGSGYSSFFDIQDSNCAVNQCQILQAGCSGAYSSSWITFDTNSPYQIQGSRGEELGYSTQFCLQCEFTNGVSNFLFNHDSYQVTQQQVVCDENSVVTKNLADQTIPYLAGASNVDLGLNAHSFCQELYPLACPLKDLKIKPSGDCVTSPVMHPPQFDIIDGNPWTFMGKRDLIQGWSRTVCIRCYWGQPVNNYFEYALSTDYWTLTQSALDCTNQVIPAASTFSPVVVQYSSSVTNYVNQGSGYTSFFEELDPFNCPIQSCTLYNSDCQTPYNQGSNFQMSPQSPWQFSAKQNIIPGIWASICFSCKTPDDKIFTQIWSYTQNELNCLNSISAADSVLPDQTFPYNALQTTHLVATQSWTDFFKISDSLNCPIVSCQIYNSDMTTYSSGPNLALASGDPWQITGARNIVTGVDITVSYQCTTPDGRTSNAHTWRYVQTKLDCSNNLVAADNVLADVILSYDVDIYQGSAIGLQRVINNWQDFFKTTDPTNCPVQCQYRKDDLTTQDNLGGPNRYNQNSDPYYLDVARNSILGYSKTAYLFCWTPDQYTLSHAYTVTQTKLDCSQIVSNLATIDASYPITTVDFYDYLSVKQDVANMAGWTSIFANSDSRNCQIQSCQILDSTDCMSPFPHTQYIELLASDPWKLKSKRDEIMGYTVELCYQCKTPEPALHNSIIKFTQKPLDCSQHFTLTDSPLTNVVLEFDYLQQGQIVANNQGYLDFFKTTDSVNCYVINCELFDFNDCTSPYSGSLSIQATSPWKIMSSVNDLAGQNLQVCYKCNTRDPNHFMQHKDIIIQSAAPKCLPVTEIEPLTMVYNQSQSATVLEQNTFRVWFSYKVNHLHCSIENFKLSSGDDCQTQFAYPESAQLRPDFTLDPKFPTSQVVSANICAKSSTGHYGHFQINFDICGSEIVNLNKTHGQKITKEYKLSQTLNQKTLIRVDEFFYSSKPQNCDVKHYTLVGKDASGAFYESILPYLKLAILDGKAYLVIKMDEEYSEKLFIKASTELSPSFQMLPVEIKVQKKTILDKLLNKAPYFKIKPINQIYIIKNETINNFIYQFPQVADDQNDVIEFSFEQIPKFIEVADNALSGSKQLLMNDIKEEGEYEIKVTLKDSFDKNFYSFFVIFQNESRAFDAQKFFNSTEFIINKQTKCDMNLCNQDRVCLECKSKDGLKFDWLYTDETQEWWSTNQQKNLLFKSQEVKMKVNSFSRNGLVTFKFNQECAVPQFIRSLDKVDYKKINVQEDIVNLDIQAKNGLTINYTLELYSWTQDQLQVKVKFQDPQLVSKIELDILDAYVMNPYLFVSKLSGDHMRIEIDRSISSYIPKQLPAGLDEGTVQQAVKVFKRASNSVLIVQILAQVFLKGSIDAMISLYYALQLICYVKEIFKINNQYPSLLQIVIKELTDLIEFKALQPEPLIQLFDEDFKLDEFIRAIQGIQFENKLYNQDHESLFSQYQLYVLLLAISVILSIIAIIAAMIYKEKTIAFAKRIKDKLFWNGILRTFQLSYMKILVNSTMHLLQNDQDEVASVISMGVMFFASVYIIYYMSRFIQMIEDKKQGLLINNVKLSDSMSWFYFPSFLIRRVIYICIPFLFEHSVYQIMALITLNLLSVSIYAAQRPHCIKETINGELINEAFVLMLSHHLLCFTDFVSSVDMQFYLGYSYALIVAVLIIINVAKIFTNIAATLSKIFANLFDKLYQKYKNWRAKSDNQQIEEKKEDQQKDQQQIITEEVKPITFGQQPIQNKLVSKIKTKKKVRFSTDLEHVHENNSIQDSNRKDPRQKYTKKIVRKTKKRSGIHTGKIDVVQNFIDAKINNEPLVPDNRAEEVKNMDIDQQLDHIEQRITNSIKILQNLPNPSNEDFRQVNGVQIALDKRLITQRQTKDQLIKEIQMLQNEQLDEDFYDDEQTKRLRKSILLCLKEQLNNFQE